MSILSAPKNLTRNVLIGMAAGVAIAAALFYSDGFISEGFSQFIEKYLFGLGGQVFKNLLMLLSLIHI